MTFTFHAVRSAAPERPAGGAASSAQSPQHQDYASEFCEPLQLEKLAATLQGAEGRVSPCRACDLNLQAPKMRTV
jgi:hypothetical protein